MIKYLNLRWDFYTKRGQHYANTYSNAIGWNDVFGLNGFCTGVKTLASNIKGKNALVVGGSGGMGSAIAKMLASQGVTSGLVGRSLENQR